MKVRAVDNENDWTFGKGRNNYKTEVNAIAQNVKCRLQCFFGDCFFNLSGGVDWFGLLGTKNVERLRLEISSCILNTEGVTGITSLEIDIDEERNFNISYSISTTYGELGDQTLEVLNA